MNIYKNPFVAAILVLTTMLVACGTKATPPPPTLTPTPPSTPRPTATPALVIGSTWTRPADRMVMMYVPEGEFTMGSDADESLAECQKFSSGCYRGWFTDEEPIHTVYLDDFWIDQSEVTNAMYEICVQADVCDPPQDTSSYTRSSYYGNAQYDDYPVIHVDWNMAKTYCEWAGARLPTEAEWEKAARGTDGRTYPWGDAFTGGLANFCDRNCTSDWADKDFDDGYPDAAPVGSYPDGVSPYGVFDMAGNVMEWVADWFDSNYYSSSPSSNPQGPSSGEYRVLRGGAWYYYEINVRTSYRYRLEPYNYDSGVGFRCSRSP